MYGLYLICVLFGFGLCQTCPKLGGGTAASCRLMFDDENQFWPFSTDHSFVPPVYPGKTIVGPGSKILFDYRTPPTLDPGFWFADMTLYPSHTNLITALGLSTDYNSYSGSYWRCDFQSYVLPDGSFYFAFTYNVGTAITETMMIQSCRVASTHIPIRNKVKVGFVSLDPAKQPITPAARSYCEGLGFNMSTGDEIMNQGGIDPYIPLHLGQTYGYLRQFPPSVSALAAQDIPIFNQLPLELSVVSGVITSVFQTVNSHINLKSNERDTPNMILLNYDKFPCIAQYLNVPSCLTVTSYGWALENSTAGEVTQKYEARLASKKWLSLYHDTFPYIASFDEMCSSTDPMACLEKKKIYGTKAASLGYIRNKQVLGKLGDGGTMSDLYGYDITPIGFGLPFQFYVDFINYPPNAFIKPLIQDLVHMETTREPVPDERYNISTLLKQAFWRATVPPSILTSIDAAISAYFTPNKINELKFRSSSNAEDLPGFDGAGLYDSFSAGVGSKAPKNTSIPCHYDPTIDDMVPGTVECTLKGVYGSLWNQRAIEERTFARYKHDTCAMGVAVIAQYKELGKVTANAVAITRLIDGNTERAGYTFSIQQGDNDVTNPDPGTVSETTIAYINPDKTWTWFVSRFATPVAGGAPLTAPVLSPTFMDQMMNVVLTVEKEYCLTKFNLSASKCDDISLNNVKTGLDIEFKFIDNTRVHCKQLREFAGTKVTEYTLPDPALPKFCGYRNPAFFPMVNGISFNNVAEKKMANSSDVRSVLTNIAYGGYQTTVYGYPSKANDGLVTSGDGAAAMANTWWQVTLDLPYTIHYVRIFWCNKTIGASAYTNPAISVTFYLSQGGTVVRSYTASTTVIQLINITSSSVANVTKVRITVTSSFFCASEVQVYALPYRTGDPNDFLPDPRYDTQDCVWSDWSSWSTCSVDCAGGTQSRTRTGPWCDNYVTMEVGKETQTCNTHVCPIDCIWNQWSNWDQCIPCGWISRNRTYIPPVGTGQPCDLTSATEKKECLLLHIACLQAPPVIFSLNGSFTDTESLINLIARVLGIDKSYINVYVTPNETNPGTVNVMCSFSGSSNGVPLSTTQQNILAQNFSHSIVTNPEISNFFSSRKMLPTSLTDSSLQNYGVGYGVPNSNSQGTTPSDSSIPFWVWIIIGVAGLLLVVVIVLLILRSKATSEIV